MGGFVKSLLVVVSLTLALASSATAQTASNQQPPFGFWLKGQALLYGNFFQAAEGTPEDDVLAGLAEIGASYRLSRTTPLRVYASYNYLKYDDELLDKSDGLRAGLRLEGRPHAFDAYFEALKDRPTFDVGDVFDRADINTVAGEYSYRFADDWSASVDGELQEQSFELTPSRDNNYYAVGAAVRYRGFRPFSPEIGYRAGDRDVSDSVLSYQQRDLYLQIRSNPTPDLYLSLRFRDRERDYNLGREDTRRQIAAGVDWTTSPHLTWNFYYAHENTDTNLAGRDFDTSLLMAGLTWRW